MRHICGFGLWMKCTLLEYYVIRTSAFFLQNLLTNNWLMKRFLLINHLAGRILGKNYANHPSHITSFSGLQYLWFKYTFFKTNTDSFMPLLQHLINLCISVSIFPSGKLSCWKTAQIIPVFKSEAPTVVSNYRPVSLLPLISLTN